WDAIDGASDRDILIDGAPDGTADACDLVVRSDGDIVVVYQKIVDKVMGNPYERVGLSVSTSANRGETWSAVVTLKDLGVERDMTGPRIVLSASSGEAFDDYSYIVWADDVGATRSLFQRALDASDSLQTERDTSASIIDLFDIPYPISHGVSFVRSTTTKVRFTYHNQNDDVGSFEFDAATDPSTFTNRAVDTTAPRDVNSSYVGCFAVDGSTVHEMHARSSDSDLYSANDEDSDTWTAPANTFTGTINHVSCNVYDRSGIKLAHIIDDGGTVKYDEDSIGAVGETIVAAQGSYSLNGQIANLLWAHKMPAAQGSYGLTGFAVITTKDIPIVAVQGIYNLVGQTVNLLFNPLLLLAVVLFNRGSIYMEQ
ncbi:hypothetical protein LCGC14_2105470, partial [marine sediment metagenome]